MRDGLKTLFDNNKSVRTGDLVEFSGIIGGKRKDYNILILNIRLTDVRYIGYLVNEDHIWLGTYNFNGENIKEILKCKINKGKTVIFTARIKPYRGRVNFGLELGPESTVDVY